VQALAGLGAGVRRQQVDLAVGAGGDTMPSLVPNFILRGARLATITTSRPTSFSGS
jgi:hypothetical protein